MSTMRSGAPTRRHALQLAGGAALAATATAVLPAPAHARPGRAASMPVLSTDARHLVNRFSYGITPDLADEVHAAGGHLAWFEQQLATAYDGSADGLCDWWPDVNRDPQSLWTRDATRVRSGYLVMYDYGRRALMRRMTSPRQVLEVMTEFWENHLHIPINADNVFPHRIGYGELLRAGALGRFEDLLVGAALHPAMLCYLGAATSTRTHPNENLGRELLELHTVGVGNYTEDDVKDSARILTGYRVDMWRSWAPFYSAPDHWTGDVKVMGFSDANQRPDGQDVARRYLSYLAHHPATARRIATKLVEVFVRDDAPATLVDRLAKTYLDNDTAIVPVLRALVASPEFGAAVDAKLRDADRDVIATYRLLGADVAPPQSDSSAANEVYVQISTLGLAPFTWPRPDGKPLDNQSWASPTRALASMTVHWNMATMAWPVADISYRAFDTWLPRAGTAAFRDVVDHLARLLLHRPSSALLLKACCEATGLKPAAKVRAGVELMPWNWPRLIAAILDSPDFYQY